MSRRELPGKQLAEWNGLQLHLAQQRHTWQQLQLHRVRYDRLDPGWQGDACGKPVQRPLAFSKRRLHRRQAAIVLSHGAEIRRISPAFTCGEVPTAANFGADYYKHVCTDFFGNPIAFTAGKPVVGADQIGTEGVPGVILMVK